ncbi:MAG: hypothetical protein OXH12_08730 [Chloroflexi bacterium]|nr:hypothetical protein [Chloroflexota bacterium]
MTLVIGLSSDNGIVLASDSQVSIGDVSVRGQKLHVSNDGKFAFGLAGDGAIIQHLVRDLKKETLPEDPEETRDLLEVLFGRRMADLRELAETSLGPGFPVEALSPPEVVVATYCIGKPHLFYIDPRSVCSEIEEGFVAIGSGAPFAEHALLVAFSHLWGEGFDWSHSAILCGRIVQDSVAASGPSVAIGGEPQYILVNAVGAMSLSEQRHTNLIRFCIDTWIAQEAETFRTAAATPLPPDLLAPFEPSAGGDEPQEPDEPSA